MLHSKTFHTRSIGWGLFGVNFRPLQKIEEIMGVGGYFSRDYGIHAQLKKPIQSAHVLIMNS